MGTGIDGKTRLCSMALAARVQEAQRVPQRPGLPASAVLAVPYGRRMVRHRRCKSSG
jgi:hypothetical protein